MKKYIVILCLTFISAFSFSQEQNNTPGSDFFIDVPTRINISNNTSIPITVYVHESECTNCQNYLNYIDISMKCASSLQFSNRNNRNRRDPHIGISSEEYRMIINI